MIENRMEVERAVWWFNPEAEGETERGLHVRCLEGEIHLKKELQPSCGFSLFKVSVSEAQFSECSPNLTDILVSFPFISELVHG